MRMILFKFFFQDFRTLGMQTIGNSSVSVDTFFLMSGLLVSFLLLRELDRNKGKFNVGLYYLHRYLRLTIVYARPSKLRRSGCRECIQNCRSKLPLSSTGFYGRCSRSKSNAMRSRVSRPAWHRNQSRGTFARLRERSPSIQVDRQDSVPHCSQ